MSERVFAYSKHPKKVKVPKPAKTPWDKLKLSTEKGAKK